MKGKRIITAVLLFGVLAVAPLAQGDQIIYDNGGPDTSFIIASDFDFPYQMAGDFVLQAGMNTITDAHWWGVYYPGNTAPEADVFTLRIFASEGAGPLVNPLYEASLGAVTRTDAGPIGGYQLFEYEVDLDPITLTPGITYYFSVVNDSANDIDDWWFWAASSNEAGDTSWGRRLDTDAWSLYGGYELAFNLTGEAVVPEPATVSLLGIGLAGLLLRRRKA